MNCFLKNTLGMRVLAALLSIGSLSSIGHAQSLGPLLKVDIPFAFESGSHRFPAGVYFVRVQSEHRLVLEGSGKRLVTSTVPDDNRDIATKNKIVFRRYGERYFLREVWEAGRSTHVHCPATEVEKQVEVALTAQNKPGVMVALLDRPR